MKDIKLVNSLSKYNSPGYEEIEEGIYRHSDCFVTCLSFQQETEYGEGNSAADISQYPLEDILNHFGAYISDFFENINTEKSKTCVLEFSGLEFSSIQNLKGIVGKHIYTKIICKGNKEYAELCIE